jgi:hypothetical protein
MDDVNYYALITDAFAKMEHLRGQRESLDAEIVKLEQFISATANFLPDQQRDLVMRTVQNLQDLQRVRDSSLTESVRVVLAAAKDWLTTTQVRERLLALGFDFSLYTTNPLASISTTLRRMKPEEVESKSNADGVTVFRWKEDTKMAAKVEAMRRTMGNRKSGGMPPPPPSTLAERLTEIAKAQKK